MATHGDAEQMVKEFQNVLFLITTKTHSCVPTTKGFHKTDWSVTNLRELTFTLKLLVRRIKEDCTNAIKLLSKELLRYREPLILLGFRKGNLFCEEVIYAGYHLIFLNCIDFQKAKILYMKLSFTKQVFKCF
jgi:hypothetical protein